MADREVQQPIWKREAPAAAAVFALALLARLLFLSGSADRHWPHSMFYEGDATTWVLWARGLARGEAFEFDLPLRTPGVAYLLYWLGAADAGSFTGYKALWCVLSAAACALAYLGFREAFSRRVSLIAAVACAFSFGLHVTATSLNNETPYMLVLFAGVWLTLRLVRRPTFRLAALIALLHGVGMLLRAEHALALLMTAGYALWMMPRGAPWPHRASIAAVIVLGAVIVCLPWSVRGSAAIHRFNTVHQPLPDYEQARPPWTQEARAFLDSLPAFAREGNFRFITYLAGAEGRPEVRRDDVERFFLERFGSVPRPIRPFVLVSMKGPLDFALANHPDAGGGFSRAALGGGEVEFAFANPHHLRFVNDGYGIGVEAIAADPSGWFALVGRKLRRFADGVTLGMTARNWPLGVEGVREPVDLAVPARGGAIAGIWRAIVWALVLGGIALAGARRTGGMWLLIIGYKVIVTILFYGYARQAVSILPAFLLFGAVAIDWMAAGVLERAKPGAGMRWAIAATIVGLLLVVEVFTAARPVEIEARGPVERAPHWGEDAFESHRRIELAQPRR